MQASPTAYKNALKNAREIAPEILNGANNIKANRVEDRGGRYLEVFVSYFPSFAPRSSLTDDLNRLTQPKKFLNRNRRRVVAFLMDKETGEFKGIEEDPVSA